MIVHIDTETYSRCDLKKCGVYRYARDPSTTVLCACWAVDGGLVQSWIPGMPAPVFPAEAMFKAYNATFDAEIWRCVLVTKFGWTFPGYHRFLCSMAQAAYANLPGKLGEVAKALGTRDKDAIGSKLMQRLCKPAHALASDDDPLRFHTAASLSRLVVYCGEDVEAERALAPRLPQLPDFEQRVRTVDSEMNRRGINIDLPLVNRLSDLFQLYAERERSRLREITHGAVDSETQLKALTEFCRARGVAIPEGKGAMSADAIDSYIALPDIDPVAKNALMIRRNLAKSSLAKLDRLQDAVCEDGRVRGLLQYYGAHQTGRWAGRLVQIQNLPRGIVQEEGYDGALETVRFGTPREAFQLLGITYGDSDIGDLLSSLLRPCFIPAAGLNLHVCDYNAIEARVLAWLADETLVLDGFRAGLDPYKVMAAAIYHVDYAAVTKAQRAVGKAVVLGAGYGLGWRKFVDYCANINITVTPEEAQQIITAFRERCARIVSFWYDCERAAINAVRTPGKSIRVGKVAFGFDGNHLKIRLPSGRLLWYRNAWIQPKAVPWSDKPKDALFFYGETDTGRWGINDTYGGKLVENITQAVARDLLADAAVKTDAAGISIVTLVHDEIVAEHGSSDPAMLERIMADAPAWAEGLPLKSKGFVSPYYRK